MARAPARSPLALPVLALLFNGLVWGTSWWPFRRLEASGLHPLWATTFIFTLGALAIVVARPKALGQLAAAPALWLIVVASGTTNAAFNWGIVIGDVVRVVLLFYLMPVWSALLARPLLDERLGRREWLRMALALAGAAIVLWPRAGVSFVALGLADVLGVIGGFSFALNNVMLRRASKESEEGRALAMFIGAAAIAALLGGALAGSGRLPWPPAAATAWLWPAAVFTLVFLCSNLALQYGAARLPASRTAVVMLSEVLFAAVSAGLWGSGTIDARTVLGGACIVGAAALAALGSDAEPKM